VDALPGQETLGVDICDWYAPEQMPARPDPTPDALAGLIYTDVDASQVMQIDHLGEPRKLVTGLNAAIHPNGGQAIVEHDDDLWIVQLASGEERNLTNSTDRGEGSPAWWQANPDLIVFNSWPLSDPAVMSYGALSTIRSDGSEYIVLSEQFSLGKYALSPDGRTIAYDQGGIPWLYDVGSGSRPLDVAEYGYQPGGNFVAASPAFSPDGRYLAWWTGSGDHADGSYRFELLVLDLAENSHQVLHSFAPVGGSGGWFINPLFSPDGRWIAFTTKDEVSRSELYVSNLSGSEEHDLGLATDAIWSPEGSRLVYLSWSASADSYLAGEASGVKPGEWIPAAINLPPGAIPRAWQVLPPPIVN
jgi:dipeptidyl aminopeptidase/acylaminoacyl peptidase